MSYLSNLFLAWIACSLVHHCPYYMFRQKNKHQDEGKQIVILVPAGFVPWQVLYILLVHLHMYICQCLKFYTWSIIIQLE